MSGFEFTMVSTFADISESEDWWTRSAGLAGIQGVNSDGRGLPRAMFVPTVHIRKGLPYSVEVGVTGSYLAYSSMFSLGAEIKTAIYESYYRWVPLSVHVSLSGRSLVPRSLLLRLLKRISSPRSRSELVGWFSSTHMLVAV